MSFDFLHVRIHSFVEKEHYMSKQESAAPLDVVEDQEPQNKICFCLRMGKLSVQADFDTICMAAHLHWRAIACTDGYVHFVDTRSDHPRVMFADRYRASICCFMPEALKQIAIYQDRDTGEMFLAYAGKEMVTATHTFMGSCRWEQLTKGCVTDDKGTVLKCSGVKELVWRPGPNKRLALYIHDTDGKIFRFQEMKQSLLGRLHHRFQHEDLRKPLWYAEEV